MCETKHIVNISQRRFNTYARAKEASVGSEINCPYCGCKFKKDVYNKVFCSNAKSKGNKNCKDNFWNKVDPDKKCRKTEYYYETILPNIAKELGFPDVETMKNHVEDFDGSWDAHGAPTVENCQWCGLRAEYCRCE